MAKKNTNTIVLNSDIKGPLVKSLFFHVVVVLIVMAGIPFFKPEPPPIEQAIMIDFIEVAEERMTTVESPPVQSKKSKTRAKSKKVAKSDKRVTPPRVTSKAPPKIVTPRPPEIDKPDDKAPKKVAVTPKRPTAKPKPPAPKTPEKVAEKKPPPEDEFQSVLKNLTPDAPTERKTGEDDLAGSPAPNFRARLGQRMTISELDSLQAQIGRCWNLMAGARYAENLIVDIRLFMNPDGSLRKAEVVDGIKYNNDRFFRAAADAALRAVHNPSCTPLKLPTNKYDQWKTIVATFDPREML